MTGTESSYGQFIRSRGSETSYIDAADVSGGLVSWDPHTTVTVGILE